MAPVLEFMATTWAPKMPDPFCVTVPLIAPVDERKPDAG